MQIRNGSIVMPCDGLYLVSLKGHLIAQNLLKLTLKTDNILWEQTVNRSSAVNLITVLFLFQQDNITLSTSSEAIISHLSISLVLQSSVDDDVKCHM